MLADWSRSEAMALAGRPDGPPLVPPGKPATIVQEHLQRIGEPIPGLLGERAAYLGLCRNGPHSCADAMRISATRDGHVASSLARPTDIESAPALDETDRHMDWSGTAWATVRDRAATQSTSDAAGRIALFDLPGGTVPDDSAGAPDAARAPVLRTAMGRRRKQPDRPTVVDFTSSWAGPLCAHLLGRRGACIIKVESINRPDCARRGSPAFFDLLHGGHEFRIHDFGDPSELSRLRELIAEADIILEPSRPRTLAQLGINAAEMVRDGTCRLSVTARGRSSTAVGFGDDVAACSGLVIADETGAPLPVGNALANPLTGVLAACAAANALAGEDTVSLDVSMLHAVFATRCPVPDHHVELCDRRWWMEGDEGRFPMFEPEIRR